jgi:two-component system response regulator PilR (NtrC family)
MRALVVDNDPASRPETIQLLESAGLVVTSVTTYEAARAWVNRHPPHLLVLDLILPDGNGAELLEHIRTQELPISVAVVSGAPNELLAQAIILRPDALFDKPLDTEKFQAWLGRAIHRWQEAAVSDAPTK